MKESKEDVEELLIEIHNIRIRIIWLIDQSKMGLERITSAQETRNRQIIEMEKFSSLFQDLEMWLEKAKDLNKQKMNANNEKEIIYLIREFEVSGYNY